MTDAAIAAQIPSMEMVFQGETLVLDPRGCLYWPKEQMLIVSDMHLEKGSFFAARKGQFTPPYDTHATLETLALCVGDWSPKTIVSLGDSFHDEDASLRLPQSCRLALTQLMEGREWVWVCGNHDPKPPANLGGTFCSEIMIGAINLIHEPNREFRIGEIAGHLHPAAKIRQRGKSLRRRCFASDGRRIIMPAFGAFTGGLNVRNEAYDGLFEARDLKAWLIGRNALYLIEGNQLVL